MTRLILLPFSAWAAIHFFATTVDDPLLRAEGLFLAPSVAALVAVLLGIAPKPRLEAPAVAVLATAVVWSVHALSTPAAAIGAMAVIALVAATARRLASNGWELDLPALCALGVGLQILLRPELFLVGPSLAPRLLEWILLPLAGAVATFWLQQALSSGGLLTALLAVTVVGGWSPLVVLWIAAAAAASHALTSAGRIRRLPLLGWLAAATVLAWQGPQQAALLLSLTVAGWLAVGALAPETRRAVRLGGLLVLLAAAAWLVYVGVRTGWPGGPRTPALLALLLPALACGALRRPREVLPLLGIAFLGLAALPAGVGLVPVLVFAGTALPRQRPLLAAQGVWSAAITGTAILLASFPWLRGDPVIEALSLFGGEHLTLATLFAIAVALALGVATTWRRSRRLAAAAAPQLVLALSLVALAARIPAAGTPLTAESVLLRAGDSTWTAAIPDAGAIRQVVVDSYLGFASTLPAGTAVARVVLGKAGREHGTWTLRAGRETGEWAARRPDIAAHAGFRAAPVWLAWVEPERRFFAQRHRAVLRTDSPIAAAEVSIERTLGAAKTNLVLTYVAVRP